MSGLRAVFAWTISVSLAFSLTAESATNAKVQTGARPVPPPATVHIVFGLTGTLIQGIPKVQVANKDPKHVIQLGSRYYVIRTGVAESLAKLLAIPGIKISIFSELDAENTSAILKAIQFPSLSKGEAPRSLADVVERVLSAADLTKIGAGDGPDPNQPLSSFYRKDLSKFGYDMNHILLVDEDPGILGNSVNDMRHLVYAGPTFYDYGSFEDSQNAAAELKQKSPAEFEQKKRYFAPDQTAWELERNKIPRVSNVLLKAIQKERMDGVELLTAVSNRKRMFTGESNAPDDVKMYSWVRRSEKLLCLAIDSESPKIKSVVGLAECERRLGTETKWKDKAARICGVFTIGTPSWMIRETAAEECEDDLRWTGEKGDVCARFSKQGQFVAVLPNASCMTKKLVYFQWRDAEMTKCTAFNACGREISGVLPSQCKGLENPFAEPQLELGFTWKDCRRNGKRSTPFDEQGNFRPECAPDTLYSWKSTKLVEKIAKASSPDQLFAPASNNRTFTWRTPMGSFGYGDDAIRIKLRPGVKFVLLKDAVYNRDCNELTKRYDITNTVFVAELMNIPDYSEYIICGDGPIHSWSYATSFFNEEAKREQKWIEDHSSDDYDALRSGPTCPWELNSSWDDGNWQVSKLNKNLREIQLLIESDKDQVFFAKDVVPNMWDHFSTALPGYFNPYDSAKHTATSWPERDPNGCRPGPIPQ